MCVWTSPFGVIIGGNNEYASIILGKDLSDSSLDLYVMEFDELMQKIYLNHFWHALTF